MNSGSKVYMEIKMKGLKIERCSKCGHIQRIVEVNNLLYTERCEFCGTVLVEGKIEQKSIYAEYLKSDHWKTTRRLALEHYGNKCDECGTTEKLEVHHKTYKNIGKENLSDLRILCRKHHEEVKDTQ